MLFLPALWTAVKAFFAFGLTANWCFRSVRTRFDLIEKVVNDAVERTEELGDVSAIAADDVKTCENMNHEYCFGKCRDSS